MPTHYNIRIFAEHPLKMGMSPDSRRMLSDLERLFQDKGIELISSSCERVDESEGQDFDAVIKRIPDILLMGVAKMFEGVLAQKMDPDSDLYDPKFVTGEPWVELVELAKDIIVRREAAKQDGSAYLPKEVNGT